MHQQASNWVSSLYVELRIVCVAQEGEQVGQDVGVHDVLDVELLELDLLVQDDDGRVVLETGQQSVRVCRSDACADVLQLDDRELAVALLLDHLDDLDDSVGVSGSIQVAPNLLFWRLHWSEDFRLRPSHGDEAVPLSRASTCPVSGCLRGSRLCFASATLRSFLPFLSRAS